MAREQRDAAGRKSTRRKTAVRAGNTCSETLDLKHLEGYGPLWKKFKRGDNAGNCAKMTLDDLRLVIKFWENLPGHDSVTKAETVEWLNRRLCWTEADHLIFYVMMKAGLDARVFKKASGVFWKYIDEALEFRPILERCPTKPVWRAKNFLDAFPDGYGPKAKTRDCDDFRNGLAVLGELKARIESAAIMHGKDALVIAAGAKLSGTLSPQGPLSLGNKFTFGPGQAMVDGNDIRLPSGLPVVVLRKLVGKFGRTVLHQNLHKTSHESEGSEELRTAIAAIRKALRSGNVPCSVISKRSEGYLIRRRD